MKRLIIVAALLASLPAVAQVERPPVTLSEYPTVDGSTSARPIGRALFLEMFGVPWSRVTREASSLLSAPPVDKIEATGTLDGTLAQAWHRIANHTGTGDAYLRLIRGEGDPAAPSLILECRLPSVDERRELRAVPANLELDCTPIAADAFVFIVREDCPVDGLTLDQVRGIYSGRITNWQEVGGTDEAILAITRNRNSGSQETMRHLVMCGRDTLTMSERIAGELEPATDMFGPFGLLHREYGQGIAYTFYTYWEHMAKRRKTKCLAIEGVAPNAETIASGEYPLRTPVWAVIRTTEPADSPARRLRDWLLNKDPQRIIEQVGYVPYRAAWPKPRIRRFEAGSYPRTDGSTSAYPLANMVAFEVLRRPWMVRVHETKGIGNTPPWCVDAPHRASNRPDLRVPTALGGRARGDGAPRRRDRRSAHREGRVRLHHE